MSVLIIFIIIAAVVVAVIAAVVVVVWAALQVWRHWRQGHPRPAGMSPPHDLRQQLRLLAREAIDYLRGGRGKSSQLLAWGCLIGFFLLFGFSRGSYLVLIILGLIGILSLGEQPKPVPPPIPPAPPVPPTPPASAGPWSAPPVPRRRSGWFGKTALVFAVLILAGWGAYMRWTEHALDRVYHKMGFDFRNEDSDREFHADFHWKQKQDPELAKDVRKNAYVAKSDSSAEVKIETSRLPAPADPAEPPAKSGETVPTAATVIDITTEPCASQAEARIATLRMLATALSSALIDSGKSVEVARWTPDISWTERNFLDDKRYSIQEVASQTPGVRLYEAHATVPVPDEKQIEQIWHRYIGDQRSGRSTVMLQAFAGTFLVIGGLAVLLRLGTSRHLPVHRLSWRERFQARRDRRANPGTAY